MPKHQCSGSYFYGEDGFLENEFGKVEGEYARIVRDIESDSFERADLSWLRLFIVLQFARTEVAVEQTREQLQRMSEVEFRGKRAKDAEKLDLSHKNVLGAALHQIKWIMPWIGDLKFCILKNRTRGKFVTSDNPVIFTNRFSIQKLQQDMPQKLPDQL